MKSERDQIESSLRWNATLRPNCATMSKERSPDPNALRTQILQAMEGLKDQVVHAKNEPKRLVFSRALEDLWVEGIENGQQELEAKHFDKAEACFELMSRVRNEPWPSLLLARDACGRREEEAGDSTTSREP